MKQTLTTYQIADALKADENANWSYAGSLALAEYLEQLEEDLGEEMELDVVAIRCDYSEYKSLWAWAKDYFAKDEYTEMFANSLFMDDKGRNNAIRKYICDNGQLIEFEGGIIVSAF